MDLSWLNEMEVESIPSDVASDEMDTPPIDQWPEFETDSESSIDDLSDVVDDFDLLDNNANEGYYVAMFLQRIIASGQGHMINRQIGDPFYHARLPTIKHAPNLERLKSNSIYTILKNETGCSANLKPKSIIQMLSQRERGICRKGEAARFSRAQRCGIANNYIPNHSSRLMSFDSKIYCGTLSSDGQYFITASQDHVLRIFDASNDTYRRLNRIVAKDVNWGILDIAFTADSEYFVYSTWSPSLHLSRTVGGTTEELVTLNLQPSTTRFCIFSVAFSHCGRLIIGGSSDGCLYGYDRGANQRTIRVPVSKNMHGLINDVNAVGYLDETSNIIFTGLDDGIIQVWDQRCLDDSRHEPVGKLVGHYDGITYIDAKNDGRYLISNSKDQSIKLWDVRMFGQSDTEKQSIRLHRGSGSDSSWDYRWDNVPKEFYNVSTPMKGDTSVMTYRGHRVKKSLIRAKFSPIESTGQRFIYTGCGTGRLIIYDTLTGKMVQSLEGHTDIVRDVAWHPKRMEVLTSSWDSKVNRNRYIDRLAIADERLDRKKRKEQKSAAKAPRRSRRIANQRANRIE